MERSGLLRDVAGSKDMSRKMYDIGEVEAIEHISRILQQHLANKRTAVFGVNDDAQAITLGDLWVFLKIDGTTTSSSKYPWLSYRDIGYRVALSSVTDLIAKNARPAILVSSITMSGEMTLDILLDITSGIMDLAEATGSLYVGGDLNRLNQHDIVVDVASVGVSKDPKPSSPFREGLTVYSTKCLGLSAIPAALYYHKKDAGSWMEVLKMISRPIPPLEFFKYSDKAVVATDISDGITSLRKVLRKSNADLFLSSDALCPEVLEFSMEEKLEIPKVLGYMGEEYAVVFASEEENLPALKLGYTSRGSGRIYLGNEELRGGWDNFLGYMNTTDKKT